MNEGGRFTYCSWPVNCYNCYREMMIERSGPKASRTTTTTPTRTGCEQDNGGVALAPHSLHQHLRHKAVSISSDTHQLLEQKPPQASVQTMM